MNADFIDIVRVISMYFLSLFVIGYVSGVFSAFAFASADILLTVTIYTAAIIAACLSALSVAVCIAAVVWFGEFLAVSATYTMLLAPALYLAYLDWQSLRGRQVDSRRTRMLRGKYRISFDERVERGRAIGDVIGFVIGAVIFMAGAPIA